MSLINTQNFTSNNFSLDMFDEFGKLNNIVLPNQNIFTGLNIKNDAAKYLYDLLLVILTGSNNNKINQLLVNHTCSFLLSQGLHNLLNVIIHVISESTDMFYQNIQKLCDDNSFTNDEFIKLYNNHTKNTMIFKQALKMSFDYFKTDNNKNILHIYLTYIFYKNVVNKKYRLRGQDKYLYEIFLQENNKSNTEEFFKLFKFYNYYYGFSYQIKKNRELLFNTVLDKIFLESDRSNSPVFLETIINNIDSDIRKLNQLSLDNSSIEEASIKIIDSISMCMRLTDKTFFMANYFKHLQTRLLVGMTNPEIEKSFIKVFNYKDDPDLYTKICFCINDVNMSEFVTNTIKGIGSIEAKSEKYKKIDTKTLDLNICKYSILRPYAWDDGKYKSNDMYGRINEPINISFYIDVLYSVLNDPNSSYSNDFANRNISVDYINSSGVIDIIMSENKTFTFTANLLQIIVLIEIANNGEIKARNLSKNLVIPLKNLGPILNSLSSIKLIIIKAIQNNDPNMTIEINKSWDFPENKVNLIDDSEKIKQYFTKNTANANANANTNINTNTTLNSSTIRAHIMTFLKSEKEATADSIEKYLLSKNINITMNQLMDMLNRLVTSNCVLSKSVSNVNKYQNITSTSIDSDDDDDDTNDDDNETNVIPHITPDILEQTEEKKLVTSNNIDNTLNQNVLKIQILKYFNNKSFGTLYEIQTFLKTQNINTNDECVQLSCDKLIISKILKLTNNVYELVEDNIDNESDTDNDNDNKKSSTVESNTVESNTVESNTVESNTVESNTVESNTVESNTVESNTVESNTVESNTVESNIVESNTVESNTVESNTVESNIVESSIVESNTVESSTVESSTVESNKMTNMELETEEQKLEYILGKINGNTVVWDITGNSQIQNKNVDASLKFNMTRNVLSQITNLKGNITLYKDVVIGVYNYNKNVIIEYKGVLQNKVYVEKSVSELPELWQKLIEQIVPTLKEIENNNDEYDEADEDDGFILHKKSKDVQMKLKPGQNNSVNDINPEIKAKIEKYIKAGIMTPVMHFNKTSIGVTLNKPLYEGSNKVATKKLADKKL
jgi:hypothetical protein